MMGALELGDLIPGRRKHTRPWSSFCPGIEPHQSGGIGSRTITGISRSVFSS